MTISTYKGNVYSYLQQSNEIVSGAVGTNGFVWSFEPLYPFADLPNVDSYIIGITEQCNLRCTYCCYSGEYKNNRIHSTSMMSAQDIDEVFAFIQEHRNTESLKVSFYGGEPLTNFSTLKYAIEKARSIWNEGIEMSVSTNGVLLTNARIDWLVEKNIRLDISIDGGKKIHDRQRRDARGNGSFERVRRAISYLKERHSGYLEENVLLLMTLVSLSDLEQVAMEWHDDAVLTGLSPTKISSLATNFAKGVPCLVYEDLVGRYMLLLDLYEKHRDWLVLKVFFEQCISYWLHRPIIEADGAIPMSTCLPKTTKLYIDSKKQISVCEKFCDKYPIGTISGGINWTSANGLVEEYYSKRKDRCVTCPAIRMCNMCLTAVEYNNHEWEVLCHNERVFTKLCLRIFCEMVERGLIE